MNKREALAAIKAGKVVLVTRQRCSIDGETVSRALVEQLIDSGALEFVSKANNFSKAYRAAE